MFPFFNSKIDFKNIFLNPRLEKEQEEISKNTKPQNRMEKIEKGADISIEENKNVEKYLESPNRISDQHNMYMFDDKNETIKDNYSFRCDKNVNDCDNFNFESKYDDLKNILDSNTINLNDLKKISWGGIPHGLRAKCWRIFLRTVNLSNDNYQSEIVERDQRYKELLVNISSLDKKIKHQIEIDILRIEEDQRKVDIDGISTDVSKTFDNILKLYAHQRPAVGYVQGIADILVPFIKVFYGETNENVIYAESGAYWCFARFIDNLQENYTTFQVGIKKNMRLMKGIVELLDPKIVRHMMNIGLDFQMFSFRWFNCHFVREFSDEVVLVIFDTMFSTITPKKHKMNLDPEKNKNSGVVFCDENKSIQNSQISKRTTRELDFARFALFLGITFFISLKRDIQNKDFAECIESLQKTKRKISVKKIRVLLASAYVNENIFYNHK